MANAISRQYIIPVLLPAAGTLSMSIIVKKIFFTGEGLRRLPRTPPPHCYNWHTTTLTLTLLPASYFIILLLPAAWRRSTTNNKSYLDVAKIYQVAI